ncbi:MAG: Lin0512 family protein [Chloroflexi bacterium]|nr:Lin0512 family protein [Chloroflexota bacterium]
MMKRFALQIGMGIDLNGQDATKAARRAVRDAIQRNSLLGLRYVAGLEDLNQMIVEVTVASPRPAGEIDTAQVLAELPYGQKSIAIVPGGMVIHRGRVVADLGDTTDEILIVNACVAVSVPD